MDQPAVGGTLHSNYTKHKEKHKVGVASNKGVTWQLQAWEYTPGLLHAHTQTHTDVHLARVGCFNLIGLLGHRSFRSKIKPLAC